MYYVYLTIQNPTRPLDGGSKPRGTLGTFELAEKHE